MTGTVDFVTDFDPYPMCSWCLHVTTIGKTNLNCVVVTIVNERAIQIVRTHVGREDKKDLGFPPLQSTSLISGTPGQELT